MLVIETSSDEVIHVIENVGARPWGIGITADGKTLYTANGPSGDASVIDAASLTDTKRIKTGQSPWGVAVTKGAQ